MEKRERRLDVDNLIKLLDTEPDDYKTAWDKLRCRITELNDQAQQTVTSLSPLTISHPDAHRLFNLCHVKDDNIDRILAVTSQSHRTNEAFSGTIIDQILISAIYEENHTHTLQHRAPSQPADPAVLELHHDTLLQRQVPLRRTIDEPKEGTTVEQFMATMLSKQVSWFDEYTRSRPDAGREDWRDGYRPGQCGFNRGGQAGGYNRPYVPPYQFRPHQTPRYGFSDGLSFRFCRIDDDENWRKCRLMEWEDLDDGNRIYSVFRSLIGMAAVLSPPAYPVEDPRKRKRETVLASFGSPERARKFDDVLCALEILEEDEETEIVGWAKA